MHTDIESACRAAAAAAGLSQDKADSCGGERACIGCPRTRASDKINDGGPAFPVPGLQHDESFNGMSLLDYFAAKELERVGAGQCGVHDLPECYDRLATHCYKMACAMLRAKAAS